MFFSLESCHQYRAFNVIEIIFPHFHDGTKEKKMRLIKSCDGKSVMKIAEAAWEKMIFPGCRQHHGISLIGDVAMVTTTTTTTTADTE